MDADEAREFLRQNHRAVLATMRSDGLPQMSPVTVAVDDSGQVLISTRETAMKTRNMRRDPRVSVCAFSDQFFGPWVQVDGQAELVALPEAMEQLVAYYRLVSGEHPDWDDYRQAMERDQRVMVRVTIGRAGPNRSG